MFNGLKEFNKIKEEGKEGLSIGKKTIKHSFLEFRNLPWKKLPLVGWFYIGFIVVFTLILSIFVVPYITI